MSKTVLFLGCGNMGEAVLKAFLKQKNSSIYIQEKIKERLIDLQKKYQIHDFKEIKDQIDILVLAIKPQQLTKINFSKFSLKKDSIILSMLAGTSISEIQENTKISKVIRIMPNLPLQEKEGLTSFFQQQLTLNEKQFFTEIFSKSGKILELKTEEDMHAATVFAGSGPGVFYYFCELWQDLAKTYGFSEKEAFILIQQMFIGSAALMKNSTDSFAELKNKVCSKGGITEKMINNFQEENLKKLFKQVIKNGINKSRKIS